MKFVLALWVVLLLVASARGNPLLDPSREENNDKNVVSKTSFFKDEFIKYRGEHTITNLVLAMNIDPFLGDFSHSILFFNQVDIRPDGERVELGQFMLVNGTAQKIFDGRCSTTVIGKPGVYFGAKDGLYVYNETKKGVDKLGTVTDSIVQLQITYDTKGFYILTEPDYRIYKVNLEGTTKALVEAIPSAKAFVLDAYENIYYYGENKVPYVLSAGSTEPVQFSSFANIENPILVRSAGLEAFGSFFVAGEEIYMLHANGDKLKIPCKVNVRITSISADAALLQYYVLDNNIYEFNFIEIIRLNIDILDGIKKSIMPAIAISEITKSYVNSKNCTSNS